MTGTTWVEESGFLEGPVMITNTHSVGVVRDSIIQWRVAHGQPDPAGYWWSLPVVAETWDGWLNDINGFHVKSADAFQAIDSASSGPVTEGNVGGGTGMVCNEFKGGIGTSSRKVDAKFGGYTVGVLVQCNYGSRANLRIAGVPESEIRDHVNELADWLGLAHRIETRPSILSASERQCVAIARAIVSRPDLLVADEPTGRVDGETALMLVRVFERLNSLGTTVLIATPDLALARQFECRHLHLEAGELTSPDPGAMQ